MLHVSATGIEIWQVFSNTVLCVTINKTRPYSFIIYCSENWISACLPKIMQYMLVLLRCRFKYLSHAKVSFAPCWNTIGLQEQFVFLLMSFAGCVVLQSSHLYLIWFLHLFSWEQKHNLFSEETLNGAIPPQDIQVSFGVRCELW